MRSATATATAGGEGKGGEHDREEAHIAAVARAGWAEFSLILQSPKVGWRRLGITISLRLKYMLVRFGPTHGQAGNPLFMAPANESHSQ